MLLDSCYKVLVVESTIRLLKRVKSAGLDHVILDFFNVSAQTLRKALTPWYFGTRTAFGCSGLSH